jgi:hypothetical protein
MRYNFDRELRRYLIENKLPETERLRVWQLRRQRAENKPQPYVNVFNLPIVKDWRNNRRELQHINGNRMVFSGGRHHWAKNDKDRKILSILAK